MAPPPTQQTTERVQVPTPASDEELRKAREHFTYDYDLLAPIALAKRVPLSEAPKVEWDARALESLADVIENHIHQKSLVARIALLLKGLRYALHGGWKQSFTAARAVLSTAQPNRHVSGLEQYDKLFKTIQEPAIHAQVRSDACFAYLRLAGPNPVWLRCLRQPDARIPVAAADFAELVPGDDLESAHREGRIFIADYSNLADVVAGVFPVGQKYLESPLALFAVPPAGTKDRNLTPIAIKCKAGDAKAPVFLRDDSAAWQMAKTVVQIADGNVHEAISHLGRTHLVMEAFALATKRQLPSQHPVAMLLNPHFEGTLFINDKAATDLLATGGVVDQALAGTIDETRMLAVNAVVDLHIGAAYLPTELAARGVNDLDALPIYPYRDDALRLWTIIQEWVREYMAIYYRGSEWQDDECLQAWLAELSANNGGRLKGIGTDGKLGSMAAWVDLLTYVIFTSSVQHAAVNFPQRTVMSYAPIMPLAGYAPAPTNLQATEADWFQLLPPLRQAQTQLDIGYLLGSVYFTKLGDYGDGYFNDEPAIQAAQRFKAALKQFKPSTAGDANVPFDYATLKPKDIPQSINI